MSFAELEGSISRIRLPSCRATKMTVASVKDEVDCRDLIVHLKQFLNIEREANGGYSVEQFTGILNGFINVLRRNATPSADVAIG